jgi:cryptochrome
VKADLEQYIYAPHKAPLEVQRKSNCIIGEQYPFPILDEHKEKDRCIARIKNSYHMGFHGNSPEVLDGSAKRLLKEEHERTRVDVEKSDKVKQEEKGTKKREREGNRSLDAFVKKTKVASPVKVEAKGRAVNGRSKA